MLPWRKSAAQAHALEGAQQEERSLYRRISERLFALHAPGRLDQDAMTLLRAMDDEGAGRVDSKLFERALCSINIFLGKDEKKRLLQRLDLRADGTIDIKLFQEVFDADQRASGIAGGQKATGREERKECEERDRDEDGERGVANPELARERYLRQLLQSQGAGGREFRVMRKLVSRLDEIKLDLEQFLRQESAHRPIARMRARDVELVLRRLGIGMEQEEYCMLVGVFDHERSGTADLQEMFRSLSLEAWRRREGNEPLLGRTRRLEEADKIFEMQQVQRRLLQGQANHVWILFKKIKRRLDELELTAERLVMAMDVNKNGSVDYGEFKKGLRHLGVYVAETEFRWDVDGGVKGKVEVCCNGRCVFDLLDSNKTGELDLFEMCYLFEIRAANAQAFHEMKQMLKKMPQSEGMANNNFDEVVDDNPIPNIELEDIPVSP
eukprot:756015-Hanusia_phi.AAC.1